MCVACWDYNRGFKVWQGRTRHQHGVADNKGIASQEARCSGAQSALLPNLEDNSLEVIAERTIQNRTLSDDDEQLLITLGIREKSIAEINKKPNILAAEGLYNILLRDGIIRTWADYIIEAHREPAKTQDLCNFITQQMKDLGIESKKIPNLIQMLEHRREEIEAVLDRVTPKTAQFFNAALLNGLGCRQLIGPHCHLYHSRNAIVELPHQINLYHQSLEKALREKELVLLNECSQGTKTPWTCLHELTDGLRTAIKESSRQIGEVHQLINRALSMIKKINQTIAVQFVASVRRLPSIRFDEPVEVTITEWVKRSIVCGAKFCVIRQLFFTLSISERLE